MNILRLIKAVFMLLAVVLVVLSLGQGLIRATKGEKSLPVEASPAKPRQHVMDRTGVIPPQDLPRFEQYLGHILRESGIDLRIAFVPDTGGKPIGQLAADMMDQLGIGGRGEQERGVLLLYDLSARRLKVEVGYGLEAWFPDAFVSYLVEDHARMHFSSGETSLGLRLMLRLLQHRIREAVIGNDFDPRVLERMRPLTHQSGGAGVSRVVGIGDGAVRIRQRRRLIRAPSRRGNAGGCPFDLPRLAFALAAEPGRGIVHAGIAPLHCFASTQPRLCRVHSDGRVWKVLPRR